MAWLLMLLGDFHNGPMYWVLLSHFTPEGQLRPGLWILTHPPNDICVIWSRLLKFSGLVQSILFSGPIKDGCQNPALWQGLDMRSTKIRKHTTIYKFTFSFFFIIHKVWTSSFAFILTFFFYFYFSFHFYFSWFAWFEEVLLCQGQ